MKRQIWTVVVFCALVTTVAACGQGSSGKTSAAVTGETESAEVPIFQADPSWPKIPSKWVFGEASGIAVDAQDHVRVLQRPRTVKPEQKAMAAPPVVEFDPAGNFVQAWGGPGEGYEWPASEHGIYVDHQGYVWITGNGRSDDQLLKFTKDGKFVMQIGRSGQSGGNSDTKNVHGAADVAVYPKTNEVFVADGYGNRRVIVFDAETGAFKRMWGAFGNVPTDPPARAPGGGSPKAAEPAREDLQQFRNVHGIAISNDGLVYVSDRGNLRFQVFTIEGKFVTEAFVRPEAGLPAGYRVAEAAFGKPIRDLDQELVTTRLSVVRTAFSADPEQRFLYAGDRSRQQIVVFDRKTLRVLGTFGRTGQAPGEFYLIHHIAVDSKGNIYTAECDQTEDGNRRAQKLAFKGLSSMRR
jgi:DNA-binding beta-propeller fold protein YncE